MSFKRTKLSHQFSSKFASQGVETTIFKEKCFWVDGLTFPPLSSLVPMIISNGGRVEMTLRPSVNHIIADVIPEGKVKQFAHQTVTKAAWIVDCVKAGKILGYHGYELSMLLPKGQQKLSLKPHTTLTDPNFVSNFFKSSRLHFIGSWKDKVERLLPELRSITPRFDIPSDLKHSLVFHIDMDCFFASVAMRSDDSLKKKPVAVSHSKRPGSGEVSSCNYVAREFGVKAGMFLDEAIRLCPALVVVPYQFEEYMQVSEDIHRIFYSFSHAVQIVSCDEVFIGIPFQEKNQSCLCSFDEALELAEEMRKIIYAVTQCTASIGISSNILLSRLATKRAKPDGVYCIQDHQVLQHIDPLHPRDLPGVGRRVAEKLDALKIDTCKALRGKSLEQLIKAVGAAKGKSLFEFSRGIDVRELELGSERKCVTVEIGWGVRFEEKSQLMKFVDDLCGELSSRLKQCKRQCMSVTVKVKKKKDLSQLPGKYLGHGICDSISKSVPMYSCSNEGSDLFQAARKAIESLDVDPVYIRAVGLTACKLRKDQMGLVKENVKQWKINVDEIDESVMKELPQFIVEEIEAKKVKKAPVVKKKITNFFKPVKKRVNTKIKCSSGNLKRSGIEIDPKVLDELPLRFRREMEHELAQQNRIERFFKPRSSSKGNVPKTVLFDSKQHPLYADALDECTLVTLMRSWKWPEDEFLATEVIAYQIRLKNLGAVRSAILSIRFVYPFLFQRVFCIINELLQPNSLSL